MIIFFLFVFQVFGQKDEYQVYSTLINSFKINNILICDKSVKADNLDKFADNLDRYKSENFEFKKAFERDTKWMLLVKRLNLSDTIHRIKNKFDSKIQTKIIRQKRLERILGNNLLEGYKKLRIKYKDFKGFTQFSNVVFDRDKTKAVVYSSSSIGMTSGYGMIYFLEKHETGWTIICDIMLWMA